MSIDTYPNIIPVFRFRPMSPILSRIIENANAEYRAEELRGEGAAKDKVSEAAAVETGGLDVRL